VNVLQVVEEVEEDYVVEETRVAQNCFEVIIVVMRDQNDLNHYEPLQNVANCYLISIVLVVV
jgi:hypothetical protein